METFELKAEEQAHSDEGCGESQETLQRRALHSDHTGAVLVWHVRGAKGEESPAAQDLLRAAVEWLQVEPHLEGARGAGCPGLGGCTGLGSGVAHGV